MAKRIKNADTVQRVWSGQTIQPGEYYTIQISEENTWMSDDQLLLDIANNLAIVNDGTSDLSASAGINWLKDSVTQTVQIQSSTRTTYSAAVAALAPASSATDIFTITGSSTKTVRIMSISITGTQTTAAQRDIILLRRSTANSGGTSSVVAITSHDPQSAPATAVVRSYTANPTLGTLVGRVRARKLLVSTTSGTSGEFAVDFGTRPSQAMVLRGEGQVFAVNLNGITSTGGSFNISVEWTEE